MANEVLVKNGTRICFCVSGSLSPADPATDWRNGESVSNVTLTLASVAAAAGRQSDKIDLGATRAPRYAVYGAIDLTGETLHASGETIDYYWAPSASTTQANGNVAGNSGADAAAPGGALGSITLAEMILMCQYIGSLVVHDGGVVQNGYVGTFSPAERYGQLIVVNNTGAAIEADDVENHQVLLPIIDEVQ